MNVPEYLEKMSVEELIEKYDWFNADDGFECSFATVMTPCGPMTKTMVERELNRRAQ